MILCGYNDYELNTFSFNCYVKFIINSTFTPLTASPLMSELLFEARLIGNNVGHLVNSFSMHMAVIIILADNRSLTCD
jgi:hypothetical protein